MLKTIEWLNSNNGNLELLEAQLGITANRHEDGRIILNYDQIKSPKMNEIVQECRGLVVHYDAEALTWKCVAKAFTRFFNYGENKAQSEAFNWENATSTSKEDGSLILFYWWKGEWRVNTRNSYSEGVVARKEDFALEEDLSWKNLFWRAMNLSDVSSLEGLDKSYTYVFELCSPYNTIVRSYKKPCVFLLAMFQVFGDSAYEATPETVNFVAEKTGFLRPQQYTFSDVWACWSHINETAKSDTTFEGLVVRDVHGKRVKLKSEIYLALHHAFSNGNVMLPKNVIPIVLKGEQDEVVANFPQTEAVFAKWSKVIDEIRQDIDNVWFVHHDEQSRKKFAVHATKSKCSWALFEAYQTGKNPVDIFNSSPERVVRMLT